MFKKLHPFKQVVSLVPFSGIQFLDFGLDIDALKTTKSFWDQYSGPDEVILRCLDDHEGEKVYWDEGGRIGYPELSEVYSYSKIKALEPFLNKWVPVPFLSIGSGSRASQPAFADGPINWARVYVAELPERDGSERSNSHRIVLAFDTTLVERPDGDPYVAPAPGDTGEFAFSPEDRGLVSEAWMDDWLRSLYVDKEQSLRNRALRDEELSFGARHLAVYLTFLRLLGDAELFPKVRFADLGAATRYSEFIDVDFVLDIGNSRTCGILIESTPDQPPSLKDNYVLELRDLSQPAQVYAQPFASGVQFSRASFGLDALSRESGRANAFSWPSVVRVGPEAERLAALARGTEGNTGLSSPKRYLWDERPARQVWRFNTAAQADGVRQPPVSGEITRFVTDSGNPIRAGRDAPAMRAAFTRSSLYTFLLCEIILQAFGYINSAANRGTRKHELAPRRLRRIILTLPPAMPVAEQKRMRERARAAVELFQKMLGLASKTISVESNLDEATSTQLVYLYDQITNYFRGDAEGYLRLVGKDGPGSPHGPSVRLASIDIGGGTTDLSIIRYSIVENRMLVPEQEFREGFRLAGDDIVEAVIRYQVLPSLARALVKAGLSSGAQLLLGLFTGLGSTEPERQRRRQFVAQVLMPIALRMLHDYESWDAMDQAAPVPRPFEWFFAGTTLPVDEIQDYLVSAVRAAGVRSFSLRDVDFPIDYTGIDQAVTHVIGQVLSNLCEVIHASDCDVVLLSGRPSRLPAIERIMLAQLPVTADRIQPMHHYRVGHWYPYRDVTGTIGDPKTTAAVGAMLCALAEGQLESFMLQTSKLRMKSTARFIGELEQNGQLLKDKVLFSDIDLDARSRRTVPAIKSLNFYTKAFLGYRQLEIERWPATRLYSLDFEHPDATRKMALPLRLKIARADVDDEDQNIEEKKEEFDISEIEQKDGSQAMRTDVRIRLQTLQDEEGYWLDTGRLDTLNAAFSAVFADTSCAS